MKASQLPSIRVGAVMVSAFLFLLPLLTSAEVLDNFDDNDLTSWEKFDFGTGNGIVEEADGQLTIGMHQAPRQQFFVAATKTSETYTIQDGRTLEFRIDLIEANQTEAYAAVGFIPSDTPVSSLTGYSVVKDANDVILAKGLNKFYFDETTGPWVERPDNITLSISMTGSGEDVIVTTRVLDKENGDEVIFERTTIDTAGADSLSTGEEVPAASFINRPGNFVVLLYHNDTNGSLPASEIILDNAEVFETKDPTLDNFNDNKLTSWEKFDFGTGNGIVEEAGGQLTIGMHQAPRQAFFVAATKSSETYTIQDGKTLEFRVDLVQANQSDAFAVLSFIPTEAPVSSLTGYSLAKDDGDVLLAKGLNKYIFEETAGPWVEKPDNITLSLTMTGVGDSVEVTSRVLDFENNNEVLYERTVIDKAGVDSMSTGEDDPAASFVNMPGNFVLLLYHNDTNGSLPASEIILDNAEVYEYDDIILDDFSDGDTANWEKFDFGTGNGVLSEEDGQITIGMHQAPRQAFFVAATFTSNTYTIEDGVSLEFQVDLIQANQSDAFTVLSFIPTEAPVSSLTGYSLAKDDGDVLLAKGLNKYIFEETAGPWVEKPDNITLSLTMTGVGDSVEVTSRMLDFENNNEVLYERTVIDKAGVDSMSTGEDDPAASFVNMPGNFVLLLYHNDTNGSLPASEIILDNARVAVTGSSEENKPPSIAGIKPSNGSLFLPGSTQVSFMIHDDGGVSPDNIEVIVNGTAAKGLTVGGSSTTREVSLGGLESDTDYRVIIRASDVQGLQDEKRLYFDTFSKENLVIESEDYNFYGEFIDDPEIIRELDEDGFQNWGIEGSYIGEWGELGVDYHDTDDNLPSTEHRYRTNDAVGTIAANDYPRPKFIEAGGLNEGVVDFGVALIQAGEWLNYTRTFEAGHYEIYLRQALFNTSSSLSTLERVTSSPEEEDQTTVRIGSFLGFESGVEYRNTRLADGLGLNPVVVSLSGESTLRLTQQSTDSNGAYWVQNYLLFRPVADPGKLRPLVIDGAPLPGSSQGAVSAGVRVSVMDRQTELNVSSVKLAINGTAGAPDVSSKDGVASISMALDPLPPPGESVRVQLSYEDQEGVQQDLDWNFLMDYSVLAIEGIGLPGSGSDPGFDVRLVQAPLELDLDSSLARAEAQLAEGSDIEAVVDSTAVAQVINYSQDVNGSSGNFPNDTLFPGIDPGENHDNMAMETLTHLELSAGIHQFGLVADDSFKVESGGQVIGIHDGGSSTTQFEFVVPKDGVYPFRMVWEETGGSAHLEWYSIDLDTGTKVLINDPNTADSIKAYRTMAAPPPLTVQSASAVTGPYAADGTAIIDTATGTAAIPLSGNARFYRLNAVSALKISAVRIEDGKVILSFE